ncbi:hypothetical protein MKEN_01179600 [Mycena kentingensis (nom. inval.)]|nr:hypothetical protein MKEN_01179600 [Mycena kentingensis (nom. inval.)]
MHRFRKRSDAAAKRPSALLQSPSPEPDDNDPYDSTPAPEGLPELPSSSVSDFRTSLILTDLSRRFTLLSAASTLTDSSSVDALKSKLANQRARGAANAVSEEEEDMIIETLGFRSNSKPQSGDEYSSRSASSSKRYSNNLFGSSRFRDNSYVRSVQKTSSIRTVDSFRTQTASHDSLIGGSDARTSTMSSGSDVLAVRSAPLIAPAPYGGQPLSVAEYRLSKSLGTSGLRRASLALEDAIKAIEEEAEDEIVMPRSTPIPRGSLDSQRPSLESKYPESPSEGGMAISSDKHISLEPDSPRASPIPSRIVPGYIPGMPRPMTPQTLEFDEQRSYSTTPRATSPTMPILASPSPRRDSGMPSRHSPRPKSPGFLQRSLNGRLTPEEPHHGDPSSPVTASWRRPSSPLSTASYQPLAVPVRPGTPSNVTWTSNGNSRQSHTRDGSWASDYSETSPARSLRSPALPDSPLIGPGHTIMNSFSSTFSSASSFESPRPMSSISGVDIGSPVLGAQRILRSPTPTQIGSRSPTAASFANVDTSSPKNGSRRSSKQNGASSPFTLGPFQPLFSPIANSSRSSLESAGSSYHSLDGNSKDRTAGLFADGDIQKPLWHDLSSSGHPNSGSPHSYSDDYEAEDVILKLAGLKKVDFLPYQPNYLPSVLPPSGDVAHQPPSPTTPSPTAALSAPPITGLDYGMGINGGGDVSSSLPELSFQAQTDTDVPSPTRRARDLTQVLFGDESQEVDLAQTLSIGPATPHIPNSAPPDGAFSGHHEVPPTSASATWPYQISRNPSTPRLPQSAEEHAELAREVQRKTEAAMVMLQKQPSASNLVLPHRAATPRKRINPSQISTPQLVSASTSVDTIPLPSPALTGQSNKIGSRLKRLRGSLRAKTNLPTADDVTPFPIELGTPPAVQAARYDPTKFRPPGAPVPASAMEQEGFKVPIPSPPASAGPGLKGFMARFRGKQRVNEIGPEVEMRRALPEDTFIQQSGWPTQNLSPSDTSPPQSAGFLARTSPTSASTPTQLDHFPRQTAPAPVPYGSRPAHQSGPSIEADESQAIRQLFDAASNLGLDQGALNDLLARSASTSSRSTDWGMLSRNNSSTRPEIPQDPAQPAQLGRSASHRSKIAHSPPPIPPPPVNAPDHLRRPKEGASEKSAVVRRTIIYPSDTRASTIDLSVLMRKQSARRRRASAASISNRSVHDRAPTPPPPAKSTHSRRISTENPLIPPVPGVQPAKPDRLLIPPMPHSGQRPSPNYDYLYDMYSPDRPTPSPGAGSDEPLPAVEVVELENGQTIWSIVNGLRDDDEYADGYNRASFGSEYSIRDSNDGMQVFFREHGRKNSGSSFLTRKKTITKSRPETKVYYSSPTEIGRLIENISSGIDSGSFNILANRPVVHSSSSSVSEGADWTVEQRIDHMLAGVQPR